MNHVPPEVYIQELLCAKIYPVADPWNFGVYRVMMIGRTKAAQRRVCHLLTAAECEKKTTDCINRFGQRVKRLHYDSRVRQKNRRWPLDRRVAILDAFSFV
jgi:hypothetical protein